MTTPNPKSANPSAPDRRNRDSRIAVCCADPARSQRYAKALQLAGFVFARDVSPETLVSSKSRPGVIDLLICDANHPPKSNDPEHWTSILRKTQPSIGAIAVTFREDPRWIVECVRRGAINCHFSHDDESILVEISSECVDRHESGVDNLKTLEERRRAIVSTQLRKAICDEAIDVYFQPIVNCSDWSCGRVEALARWTDDSLGVVSPVEFVTAAEEEGFVSTLGQLVLRKSLLALADLGARKHTPLFSINVSRRQFDNPNLVKEYLTTVLEYGASPSQIVIEVTETAKFENDVLALSLMQDFIDAGFQLAVDDFGTGESSFLQMSHIRYSELKIDRSLVSCIFEPSGLSIMRSVIGMAKSLNMHLVAEGVEDQHTAELLKSLEIDFCQGYHFARPMALENLKSFLDDNSDINASTETSR
ncbi:EAL domain-containing protein [Pelagicoccus sp. SDUM812002]|uniref:EAL domain-containing protein n=1 Tax=Pelagicoccus sp. SDUM812002 TaxID=3041266 RepID=UPI00280C5B54|nr:EAL domain-containing protein [Pelagicoccus sp. SDUM812002]MDQ8186470.1 EAL domain-containing protein [Pelagicoccus sp. SDUM812002]